MIPRSIPFTRIATAYDLWCEGVPSADISIVTGLKYLHVLQLSKQFTEEGWRALLRYATLYVPGKIEVFDIPARYWRFRKEHPKADWLNRISFIPIRYSPLLIWIYNGEKMKNMYLIAPDGVYDPQACNDLEGRGILYYACVTAKILHKLGCGEFDIEAIERAMKDPEFDKPLSRISR